VESRDRFPRNDTDIMKCEWEIVLLLLRCCGMKDGLVFKTNLQSATGRLVWKPYGQSQAYS
jgi:hypothetical protein